MKHQSKARRWPLAAGAILLLGLSAALAVFLWTGEGGTVAFTVNGSPVTRAHEQIYLDDARARTASYYYTQYGADPNGADFWDTEFDGQTPAQYQLNQARAALVRDMVERQLARDHGIEAAVTLAEAEAAREERNRSGGIQYGPDEYGAMEFLSQTQSQLRDALKAALLAGELAPAEADLRALYERADVRPLLDEGYSATVRVFAYATVKAGQYPPELDAALELAGTLWSGGLDEAGVLGAVEAQTGIKLDTWIETFDTADLPKEEDLLPLLAEVCRDVPSGVPSAVWESGVTHGIALVLERDDRGQADIETARTVLTNLWINERYEAYLNEAVAAAEIGE